MQLKMYATRDVKAGLYSCPFYKITHGLAEREFESAVNDKQTTINQYPKDFDLYYLGEYDDSTGKMTPLDTPEHIISAVQLLKNRAQNSEFSHPD